MHIVPTTRLIVWTAIVLLPFSALTAVAPSAAVLSWAFAVIFAALVVFDGLRLKGSLDAVFTELPAVVRLTSGREGYLRLRVRCEDKESCQIRIGLPLPPEIRSPSNDWTVALQDAQSSAVVRWPCLSYRQGRYRLECCFVECRSPLGLLTLRSRRTVETEFRVFPNLYNEARRLPGLLLHRNIGIHTQRQVGKGRDFEQLREYLPGDNYEDIHWKAFAKRGEPVTKIYQIERTQDIYVFLDASRLSTRSLASKQPIDHRYPDGDNGSEVAIWERFTTAALILGMAAERHGDLFGLLTFDNQIRHFIRAKSGRAHFNACRDILYTLRPSNVSPDFTEVFTFIGTHIRRRALLVFLTSLDDPIMAENFVRHIDLISRRHLIQVTMLQPVEAQPLFHSTDVATVDDLYGRLGGFMLWQQLQETARALYRQGVGAHFADDERLCSELVTRYLAVKRRQIL